MFTFFTSMRSVAVTIVCLCGAIFDNLLHFFTAKHEITQGGVQAYVVGLLLLLDVAAIIYLAREHWQYHRRAKLEREETAEHNKSIFAIPAYSESVWHPPHFERFHKHFSITDHSDFQDSFNEIGFIPPQVIYSV